MSLSKFYREHLASVLRITDIVLDQYNYDSLVIYAGNNQAYFADDQNIPFRVNPYFAYFCPLWAPYNCLQIVPGRKPRLIYFAQKDFWHEVPEFDTDGCLQSMFEVVAINDLETFSKAFVATLQNKVAYIGPSQLPQLPFTCRVNPKELIAVYNWHRSVKSAYEVMCISEANAIAAKGHIATRQAFLHGASEFELLLSFLSKTKQTEQLLPYGAIIGLNEKAAILHYQNKRISGKGQLMLVDAGATYRGYGSDITRTVAHSNSLIAPLVTQLDQAQQHLCSLVKSGVKFSDLHHAAHVGIAQILLNNQVLINCSVEAAIDKGLTSVFFPHGLGHMLGLQTHDVGGQQKDVTGNMCEPNKRFPKLRLTRALRNQEVLTIEPGIYFIPMLLEPFRQHKNSSFFNWHLLDQLIPFGGVRIEDNIVVNEQAHINLTRKFLPNSSYPCIGLPS